MILMPEQRESKRKEKHLKVLLDHSLGILRISWIEMVVYALFR